MQFLIIIKGAVDATVKANFAAKIAHLAETFAEPAEYATTMADVLEAAGPAAPKELANRVSNTVAFCGDATVQADTAGIFLKLLKDGQPLSEAQLLVCFIPRLSQSKTDGCLQEPVNRAWRVKEAKSFTRSARGHSSKPLALNFPRASSSGCQDTRPLDHLLSRM
jgi:hypothetical protein